LSCSNDKPCRHVPCSSFRSSEESHAWFTIVVLGCLTRPSLVVLPVGCLCALAAVRVGCRRTEAHKLRSAHRLAHALAAMLRNKTKSGSGCSIIQDACRCWASNSSSHLRASAAWACRPLAWPVPGPTANPRRAP
jgi:hypothetical protein